MKWRSLNDGNIKLTKENRRAQNCPTFPSSKTSRTGRLQAWTRIIIQPLYVVKATFSFSSNYTLAFAQSAPNFVRHSNDLQVFYTENGCRINNAAEQQTNILIQYRLNFFPPPSMLTTLNTIHSQPLHNLNNFASKRANQFWICKFWLNFETWRCRRNRDVNERWFGFVLFFEVFC